MTSDPNGGEEASPLPLVHLQAEPLTVPAVAMPKRNAEEWEYLWPNV